MKQYELFDDFDEDKDDDTETCDFCGEEGLHWDDVESETMRLHTEDNVLHVCQPTAEGFDALEEDV